MPIPSTKLTLSTVVTGPGGYRLLPNAPGDFVQTTPGISTTAWVAGISDLNGDGIPDFIVGAPGDDNTLADAGRIFVDFGAATGGTTTVLADFAEVVIDGVHAGDLAGAAVGSVADLNADGLAEFLVGAPMWNIGVQADAGAAFVLWGKLVGGIDLNDPATGGGKGYIIRGELAGDHAGQAMASIGDLNGDLKAEILVGAAGNDAAGVDAGAAYVVWGKSTNTAVNLTNVAAGTGGFRIVGQNAGDAAGRVLTSIADLNGDGKQEILLGAAGNDAGGLDAGAAYVVYGQATGTQVDLNNVAAGTGGFRITGASVGEQAGVAVSGLGDVNGDGLADILVGAPGTGRAYVVYGKADTTEVLLSNVSAGIGGFAIVPEVAGDLANLSVAGGGDFNRDGIADIVIGAPNNAEGGLNAGAVYVIWGGDARTVELSQIALGAGGAKIVGYYGSLTGSSVAVMADMNGDATPDLLIGSPGAAGESVSVVYSPASWQPDANIYGTGGNDIIGTGYGGLHKVGEGDDAILGMNGNDIISGASGNDRIEGNAGNDTLNGEAGNDTLDGGTGADSMAGGLGDDTFHVDNVGDVVLENLNEGTDKVIASLNNYTLAANIENLDLAGAALAGNGNALDNIITGTTGNNTLNGGAGADTLIGGLGNDTYLVDNIGDVVLENAAAGTDKVTASIDWTLGANIENLQLTGAARVGIGNALNNNITGTGGNDTLDGGAGNDTLAGGLGDDTYYIGEALDVVQENAAAGTETVVASVNNHTLAANVENLLLSGSALAGNGNTLNNTLVGTAGNNTLNGGAGTDTMNGGLGDDTYYVDNAGDVVQEAFGEGTDTVISSLNHTLAANVENLQLTGTALIGTGNDLANSLTGTAGNNTLDGGAGIDTLIGGLGDDTYYVDNAGDVIQEALNAGMDTAIASADYTLGANVENLQLVGTALVGTGNDLDNRITGTAADNQLNGAAGNDTLDGGAGADTLAGGDGDDTYYVDHAGDLIQELPGGGNDITYTSVDWVASAGVETIRLTGAAHVVTGNDLNNLLTGGGGNDTLDGGAGDDLEQGGEGNDDLISDSGFDTLSGGGGDDRYVLKGGHAHIEDWLGHDSIDASESSGDSYIDLSGDTPCNVGGSDCDLGVGGTTSAPLDVQFLQDLSGSFGDDIANVRGLVPGIVAALQAVQPNSQFGASTFIDKPVSPFGAVGEWVYNTLLPLTANAAALTATYNAMATRNGMDAPESQIEALMQLALHTGEVGFRPDSARFVILFTDAPFHVAGDGAAAGITTPNNGDAIMDGGGIGEDYPLVAQVRTALIAANLIPIFAIAGGNEPFYQGLVTDLGRGTVVTLTTNSSNVIAAITAGLTAATQTQIEDAIGGAGNDTLRGNAVANALAGNRGDDLIDGGAGADTLLGDDGNDRIVFDAGDAEEHGGVGTDTLLVATAANIDLGAADQTLGDAALVTGFENVNASAATVGVVLTGDGGANLLIGGSGDDLIDGRGGADTLQGGDGNDLYGVDDAGDSITELALGGTDTVLSSISWTLGANLEHLTLTGAAAINAVGNELDNALTGNTAANNLSGAAGNDTLDGGEGIDTMKGGLGDDTYVVDNTGDVVTEYAGQGIDTVLSSVTRTLGSHQENLTLTGTANVNGTGNTLDNVLNGNIGNNVLNGKVGADTMAGGAGNDTYLVDDVGDVVIENAGEGTDTVKSSISYTLGAEVEKLILTGTADLDGTGNALNNNLTGNAGNNVLDGGAGNDTMAGGAGDDTYYVDGTGDRVSEGVGKGIDTVLSSISKALWANVENLILTGTANLNGTGNTLDNVLTGNSGNNVLNGGVGADTMIGGLGNDTYVVDNVGDVVIENAGEGTDTVKASIGYTLAANVEKLILTGTGHIDGTGNALNNTLTGNAGNNVLNGGDGKDTLTGGAGQDIFRFDTALNASTNLDTIKDFSVVNDTIELENAIFTQLMTTGTLAAGHFSNTGTATDADDYLVYNATTGALYYDADGNGGGAAVKFATLTGAPAITEADFVVT